MSTAHHLTPGKKSWQEGGTTAGPARRGTAWPRRTCMLGGQQGAHQPRPKTLWQGQVARPVMSKDASTRSTPVDHAFASWARPEHARICSARVSGFLACSRWVGQGVSKLCEVHRRSTEGGVPPILSTSCAGALPPPSSPSPFPPCRNMPHIGPEHPPAPTHQLHQHPPAPTHQHHQHLPPAYCGQLNQLKHALPERHLPAGRPGRRRSW